MTLVDDLRTLVAAGTAEYTAGTATYWSDAQLQASLNHHRALIDFEMIDYLPRTVSAGSVEYKRGQLHTQYFVEAGTAGGTVQDGSGGTVTTWTITRDGWVDFSANTLGTAYYFTGWSYDLYAAAAEVCTSWASSLKGLVDVSTDDQSLKLSQKVGQLKSMADDFSRMSPIRTGVLVRDDAL